MVGWRYWTCPCCGNQVIAAGQIGGILCENTHQLAYGSAFCHAILEPGAPISKAAIEEFKRDACPQRPWPLLKKRGRK